MPDAHAFAFRVLETSDGFPRISVIEESSLFDGVIKPSWHKYALQMALKLLVAQRVTTKYFITLDADIIFAGILNIDRLLPDGKASHHSAII